MADDAAPRTERIKVWGCEKGEGRQTGNSAELRLLSRREERVGENGKGQERVGLLMQADGETESKTENAEPSRTTVQSDQVGRTRTAPTQRNQI